MPSWKKHRYHLVDDILGTDHDERAGKVDKDMDRTAGKHREHADHRLDEPHMKVRPGFEGMYAGAHWAQDIGASGLKDITKTINEFPFHRKLKK